MPTLDDILAADGPQQGTLDDILGNSPANIPAPVGIRTAANRSAVGEVYTGLKRGVVGELPKMVGQAAKWATEPESRVYKFGQGIVNAAEARLAKPEIQLNPEGHNAVTNALAEGAEMLAPSVAIPLVVGAGLAAAPTAAVPAAVGLGISALAGAVPMGMAQAQDTMERVKEAGGDTEAARIAGWKSGAIEAGGETIGTYLGGKLLGIGGKALSKVAKEGIDKVIANATDSALWKPFAKQLFKTAVGEVATEMGQGYGQAVVEKNAGVDVDPWQQTKDVIAPTLGMTALLAPFGLAGHYRNSRRAEAVDQILADPKAAPAEARLAVVHMLHTEAVDNNVPGAEEWFSGAVEDIANEMPIRRAAEAAVDPVKDSAQKTLLKNLGVEGVVHNGKVTTEGGEADVDTLAQTLAQGGSVVDAVKKSPARLAELEAKALGGEQFTPDERKEYQKLLAKSGTKKFEQLEDDPVRPEVVRFQVYNDKKDEFKVYEYAPPAGMTREQVNAELAKRPKSPGSQFNWLEKNATKVKRDETEPQATPANEPVQAVQPGPEQVVDGVSEPLTPEPSAAPASTQPVVTNQTEPTDLDTLTFQHDTLVDQWEALPVGLEKTAVQEEIFKIREEMNNVAIPVPPEGGVGQGVAVAPSQTPAAAEPAGTLSQVLEAEPAGGPQKSAGNLPASNAVSTDSSASVGESRGELQLVRVAAKVDKDLKYNGDNLGLPQFTYQAGPLKGVTFSAKDASEESVRSAAEKMKAQWEGKKNNAVVATAKPVKEEGQVHDYSNTQVNIKGPAAKKITDLGKSIPDSELYTDPNDDSYGRETEPHITVRYGLGTDNPAELAELSKVGPVTAKIGKVSIFETDKYDVVKAEIISDSLRGANKKVGDLVDLPGETYKDYQPHATIAYVKKGEGKKYVGNASLEGTEITFNEIALTDRFGKTHPIKLTGDTAKSPAKKPTLVKAKPEKKVTSKKAEKPLPSAYAAQAKVIAEDIASGDTPFKRVPSDAAIRAYRAQNPRAKADAAMAEIAEMDEAEYQGLTAVIEDEQVKVADAKAGPSNLGDPSKAEAEKVQKGIEGKTPIQAAEWLINNTPNNGHKLIAAKVRVALLRLKGAGVEFNLNVTHVGDSIPASSANSRGVSTTDFSDGIKTTVRLNGADVTGKVGMSYETVLHELIHAATQAAIHVGNRKVSTGTTLAKATAEMVDVTNLIIDHFNTRAASGETLTEFEQRILQRNVNALNNPSEVLAWTLSNKEMQDYLETVKLGKTETLWSRFVQSVRTFFGLTAASDTALSEVLRLGEDLLNADANVVTSSLDKLMGRTTAEQVQTPLGVIADEQISEAFKSGQKKLDMTLTAIKNPKSKLHDLYVQYAPQWLAVTPLHTLVQTFGKTIPQIKDFAKHLDAVVSAKTEIVDTSKVVYDKAMEVAQKTVGLDVFNTAAATASFNRITPWLDVYSQDWVEGKTKSEKLKNAQKKWVAAKMQKATKLTYIEAYSEAKKAYDALKTNEMKQAYQDTVEHIAGIRTREKNNLLRYIEKVTEPNSDERKEMMLKFDATFTDLHGAYWPLARVGDFVLKYVDKDGFKWAEHFTTIAERNEAKAERIAAGVDPAGIKESYKDKQPAGAVAIPAMMLEQLSKTVREKYMVGVNQYDDVAVADALEAAQNTINDMTQIWLRWQPETSALKNSVRRKNVKGYSLDMLRSYLDYMQRHASNIAWTEQGKKIEGDLKSMGDDIKAKLDGDAAANTDMENHLLNDLRARVQALRSVKVGVAASFLGKIGTGWYMTSPSIALVQMTQLGALTLPKLAVKYGPVKAAKALALWTKESFKKDYRRAPMFNDPIVELLFDELHAVVTIDNRNTPAAKGKELGEPLFTEEQLAKRIADELTPYQRRLLVLREAMARNLLDISAAHEAYDLTRGKDPDSMMSKVFNLAMKPMSLSELTSRKAAVLSTYDLASQDGKEFFLAMNDIAEVVNDTLYSYSKENKGAALQGGLTRVVLQFQHYRIMTGIRLAMLLNNAIRGESKEIKAAATKEFVGIMGMTGALAGSLGMPFAGTVFAILGAILGDDDEPEDYRLMYTNWLQNTFPKTMADLLTHGLPSLVGADISKRVGLQDVYGMQSEPPPRLHGKELAAWWAANQLGPVFSVGAGLAQGYDEMINKGNYMKGLEAAAPKPIKDVFKAIRAMTDGVKTGAGKKLIPDDQIGPDDVLMIALGFNPEEISKAQGAERSLRGISTRITERRGKLIRRAAEAILEGDGDSAAMEDIRKFNLRMPRFAIGGRDIKPAVRKILRGESGTTGRRERDVATQYEVPAMME